MRTNSDIINKAGIMEEMMEDTLAMVDDDEELEEEADAEVDAVLFNITEGKLGKAGTVTTDLPVSLIDLSYCSNKLNSLALRLRNQQKTRQKPKQQWLGCKSSCTVCCTLSAASMASTTM